MRPRNHAPCSKVSFAVSQRITWYQLLGPRLRMTARGLRLASTTNKRGGDFTRGAYRSRWARRRAGPLLPGRPRRVVLPERLAGVGPALAGERLGRIVIGVAPDLEV